MAKNSFDSFSKQLLEEILSPYGAVEVSREVPGESQFVDVYFEPSSQSEIAPQELGLLGHITQTPCLLEPFRNQPTPSEVRSCLLKLYQVHGDYQRKARREKAAILENDLPHLWILASSASENLLNGFGFSANNDWPSGVYLLHPSLRTAIISINQLPRLEETIFLRLLGKGQTQKQAVDEVIGLDAEDSRRSAILRLLASWKISLEITGQAEEEELMMVLSQAYLEWEQQTEQRGEQTGEVRLVLRQLTRRIGDISPDVRSQVQALSLTQLESLGEALLDFSAPRDLESWLVNNTAG
ncbi:DUF4351 domain-containing protein [Synechococcales cyanobacterium C]|uniref:DUF4351 domain-containing protein n=1 Tax=Petrachloros mirabilis ULC683 TaxID=2781853 RepID=A0A8K1ZW81_9CYAN|nr:DUF4351 domain-containing protein [Petrachloros mirabilis ULC683]